MRLVLRNFGLPGLDKGFTSSCAVGVTRPDSAAFCCVRFNRLDANNLMRSIIHFVRRYEGGRVNLREACKNMPNDLKFGRRVCGLLFDFDGLMVDTEYPSYQGWTELFKAYGCTLDLEKYAKHIGSPGAYDLHGHLESLVGKRLSRVQLQAARRRRYRELTTNQKLLPGVQGYLDSGRERGLRIGIVSGSPDTWVESHLIDFGIRRYFDCVVTAGDVSHNKPNPEGYDRALGCLAIRADEAIAFEDSPHGVTAARRAGIYCVAVPNGVTRRLSLEHANRVVPSLADVPLSEILRQFENGQKRRNSRKEQ